MTSRRGPIQKFIFSKPNGLMLMIVVMFCVDMEVLLCGTLTYQHYRDGKKTELTKQG
jgi:hypothetical protein